jgi:hypothetical protein
MKRVGNDEQGAVLAIVALSLIALMGMVILVIDVGGLLVMKRRLVTTADSATLAAAQQCAQGNGEIVAVAEANEVAEGNVDTSRGKVAFTPSCTASNGEAFARYRAGQQLFFAPILGLGDDMTVSAPAKAIWGPAQSGLAVPLMVSAIQFRDKCSTIFPPPTTIPPGKKCGFYYDSDDIGTASWGWMNLRLWDMDKTDHCVAPGAKDREDWIYNNYPDLLSLNWTDPTYVCTDTGAANANWQDVEDIIGDVRTFPVNDPDGSISLLAGGPAGHGQVDRDGDLCPPAQELANNCTLDKYDIIGFTVFKIFALYDGDEDEATGSPQIDLVPQPCPGHPIKHTFTRDDPPPDSNTGPTFDLTDLIDACIASTGVSAVLEPPDVQNPYTLGDDYTYDSVSDVITWIDFPTSGANEGVRKNIDITLYYDPPATGGSSGWCGDFGLSPNGDRAKNQDKCLVVEWVGFSSAGSNPGTGPDFGLRAIQLVE